MTPVEFLFSLAAYGLTLQLLGQRELLQRLCGENAGVSGWKNFRF